MVFFETINAIFPIISLSLILLQKSNKGKIKYFLGFILTIIIVYILKYSFSISRPENGLIEIASPSFPSTHAALGGYPLGFFLKDFDGWLVLLLVLFALLSASSRLFLGVHREFDIIVGLSIGILSGLIIRYYKK